MSEATSPLAWDLEDGLRIRVRRVGPIDNAAYVVACPETGAAVLIDAANEAERLIEAVGDLELVAILETHGHADHWQALAQIQRQFPMAWTGAHRADLEMFPNPPPERALAHGEKVRFGNRELEVLATPGHTPGSICFYHPGYVFTGDTLFPGGPGATIPPLGDFPTIVESIRTWLLPLPAATVVLPGHGAATSIGSEAPHFPDWAARGW
ncbi:MAG TPA: MBL fold metallo-hydrolase [Candidatus Dormibacteraeota bacterium]|nr:MBL fold metallo-hydrolase [Candidatus Dormibacteraeota bacterium]